VYRELMSLSTSVPKRKEQVVARKLYEKYWFNTKYSSSFRFYAHQFYQDKKKVLPRQIGKWLTPLALAVWFMDDGSIKSKYHKALILNTQGFTLEEVRKMCKIFNEKFGIKAKPRKQKEGYQIYLLSETVEKFRHLISPHMISSMRYKLG
jgi:DNA-binding transcriptional regulator WhiA